MTVLDMMVAHCRPDQAPPAEAKPPPALPALPPPPDAAAAPESPTAGAASSSQQGKRARSASLRMFQIVQEADPEFSPEVTKSRNTGRGGRVIKGGPSRHRGVVWHKSNQKYEARIYDSGRQKFLGYYLDEDTAAIAYDDYAAKLHGSNAKLNFPHRYEHLFGPMADPQPRTPTGRAGGAQPRKARARKPAGGGGGGASVHRFGAPSASAAGLFPLNHRSYAPGVSGAQGPAGQAQHPQQAQQQLGGRGSSRYRGVSWNASCNKWRAQVWKGSEVHHIGYFSREEDAARAYDAAAVRIRGPSAATNYGGAGALAWGSSTPVTAGEEEAVGSSRYLGVSSCPSARQWVAELWDGCSYRLLGAFDAEEHAARAYDMACLEQHGSDALTNFPLPCYETELAALSLLALAGDQEGWRCEPGGIETGSSSDSGSPTYPFPAGPGPAGSTYYPGALPGPEAWLAPPAAHAAPGAHSPRAPPLFVGGSGAAAAAPQDPLACSGNWAAAAVPGGWVEPLSTPQQEAGPCGGGPGSPTGGSEPTGGSRPGSGLEQHSGRVRGASPFMGVSWDKRKHKWFAQIQQSGKRYFLGYYEQEAEAGRAYDRAALRLFGPSAQLNFPAEHAEQTLAPYLPGSHRPADECLGSAALPPIPTPVQNVVRSGSAEGQAPAGAPAVPAGWEAVLPRCAAPAAAGLAATSSRAAAQPWGAAGLIEAQHGAGQGPHSASAPAHSPRHSHSPVRAPQATAAPTNLQQLVRLLHGLLPLTMQHSMQQHAQQAHRQGAALPAARSPALAAEPSNAPSAPGGQPAAPTGWQQHMRPAASAPPTKHHLAHSVRSPFEAPALPHSPSAPPFSHGTYGPCSQPAPPPATAAGWAWCEGASRPSPPPPSPGASPASTGWESSSWGAVFPSAPGHPVPQPQQEQQAPAPAVHAAGAAWQAQEELLQEQAAMAQLVSAVAAYNELLRKRARGMATGAGSDTGNGQGAAKRFRTE